VRKTAKNKKIFCRESTQVAAGRSQGGRLRDVTPYPLPTDSKGHPFQKSHGAIPKRDAILSRLRKKRYSFANLPQVSSLYPQDPHTSASYFSPDVCLSGALWSAMQRTSIFLTASEKEKLAKLSKESGISIAEIIRRAIDDHLAPLARHRSGRGKRTK
jgi:hypothetical protein